MIKLIDILFENTVDYVYHLTKLSNLDSIKKHGLRPTIPVDMDTEEEGVYVFKTKEDAEDALQNWYGDRYDDSDEFAILTIKTDGLRLFSTLADYEYVSYETIPPSNIVNMEKI
jgi:hypothetical protein